MNEDDKAKADGTLPDDEAVVDMVLSFKKDCENTRAEFLREAEKGENFYNGHQWEEGDVMRLREQNRPAITFNLVKSVIDVVAGTELNTRQSVYLAARHPEAADSNELGDLATDTLNWAIESADIPDERSQAFVDTLKVGMGWMGLRVDFERDLDGRVMGERVDYREMGWDPNCQRQNLDGARYVIREKYIHKDDFDAFWPGMLNRVQVNELLDDQRKDMPQPLVVENTDVDVWKAGVQTVSPGFPSRRPKGHHLVTECQYWTRETVHRILVPPPAAGVPPAAGGAAGVAGAAPPPSPPPALGGGPLPGSPSPPVAPPQGLPQGPMPAQGAPPQPGGQPQAEAQPQAPPPPPPPPTPEEQLANHQHGVWMSFAEPAAIETDNGMAILDHHQFKAWKKICEREAIELQSIKQSRITYRRAFVAGRTLLEDEKLPIQVGFTYQAITGTYDPKKKVWYGMIRNLMDPQSGFNKWFSQGISIISTNPKGTLLVETTAVKSAAQLESNWARPGGTILLNDQSLDRVKVIDTPPFPAAYSDAAQFAKQAIYSIAAINPETMGMSTGDTPALTERQRQGQTLTILAPLFNALTRYRKMEARCVLELVKEFIADGRLIRVGGQYSMKVIPLLKSKLAVDFDLIIDENPRSPNQKAVTFEAMQPVLPTLFKMGIFPPEILDYFPFPAPVVEKIKQYVQGVPPGGKQKANAKPPELIAAEVEQKKAQTVLTYGRARLMDKESELGELLKKLEIKDLEEEIKQKSERHSMDKLQHADDMTKSMLDQALTAAEKHQQGLQDHLEHRANQEGGTAPMEKLGDAVTKRMMSPKYPAIK